MLWRVSTNYTAGHSVLVDCSEQEIEALHDRYVEQWLATGRPITKALFVYGRKRLHKLNEIQLPMPGDSWA